MSNRKIVYLDDVFKAIEVFYDATFFCKKDVDQVKMLCDAISIRCDEAKYPIQGTGTIETTTDQFHVMHQVCSECGETQPWKEYPKFCSNCGVRFTNKECE